jgi:hypothetical protein
VLNLRLLPLLTTRRNRMHTNFSTPVKGQHVRVSKDFRMSNATQTAAGCHARTISNVRTAFRRSHQTSRFHKPSPTRGIQHPLANETALCHKSKASHSRTVPVFSSKVMAQKREQTLTEDECSMETIVQRYRQRLLQQRIGTIDPQRKRAR